MIHLRSVSSLQQYIPKILQPIRTFSVYYTCWGVCIPWNRIYRKINYSAICILAPPSTDVSHPVDAKFGLERCIYGRTSLH